MVNAKAALAGTVTEKVWQASVVEFAQLNGWTVVHQLIAQGTTPGWPDLVCIRPPDIVFIELKTERGRLTDTQTEMLTRLQRCGAETYVARPSDSKWLFERLARRPLAKTDR